MGVMVLESLESLEEGKLGECWVLEIGVAGKVIILVAGGVGCRFSGCMDRATGVGRHFEWDVAAIRMAFDA